MISHPPTKKTKLEMTENSENDTLDAKAMNKFSRQIAAFGAETTAKLTKMKVIIYGLRGVGMETAKNLSLQGVGAITLVDQRITQIQDLGVNFFLSEEDVAANTPRAYAIAPKLRELNPMCDIKVADSLSEELIKAHTALVISDSSASQAELIRLNDLCRSHKVSFFYGFTGGATVSVFVDHGDNHFVNDPNGERPVQKIITDISHLEADTYIVRYETPEGQTAGALDSGTFEISDVDGLEGINGVVVEVSHPYSDPVKTIRVTIPGISSTYVNGGLLTEKKLPKPYPMTPLREKFKNPGSPFAGDMVMTDLIKFSEQQHHVALTAVLTFAARNSNNFPRPNSQEDAAEVLKIAKELITTVEIALEDFEVDEAFCLKYATYAAIELQPLSAFLGGVLAQEVVKSTGKFTPIPGWMHFSAFEALPDAFFTHRHSSPRVEI